MPRRVSTSQIRSKLRQAQQKQRQAVNKLNQAINSYNQKARAHNQKVKAAVDTYNREVRAYNARVRANRTRLASQLNRLRTSASATHYTTLRSSVETVQTRYRSVEHKYEAGVFDDRYNEILDLSEREAANSASVMNALLGDAEQGVDDRNLEEGDAELISFLEQLSADLGDRWKGALFSLNPMNPDAARHFCTSAREVITAVLEIRAPDARVSADYSKCEYTPQGKPTRRSKIGYLLQLQGLAQDDLAEFVEADIANVLELFRTFNDGTHGTAGKFDIPQLRSIKKRVEDGLGFLRRIVG